MKGAYIRIAGYAFDKDWYLCIPSEIGDAITSISVVALESQKDIIDAGLDALNTMCLTMIKRDRSGYDVSRLAARIGVIGAIALERRETQIAEKATTLLVNFEATYQANSPEPHKGLTIDELISLHKETIVFQATEKYLDFYKKLDYSHIESFIQLIATTQGKKKTL